MKAQKNFRKISIYVLLYEITLQLNGFRPSPLENVPIHCEQGIAGSLTLTWSPLRED